MLEKLIPFLSALLFSFCITAVPLLKASRANELSHAEELQVSYHKPIPTVSVGAPTPLSLGMNYALNSDFSFLVTAGYLPVPFLLKGNLSVGNFEAWAKWHPFHNSYFIGAALGYQWIGYRDRLSLGSFTADSGPLDLKLNLTNFNSSIATGFFWKLDPKTYIGFDIGVQIPIVARGGIGSNSDDPMVRSLESASRDVLSYFAGFIIPRITLLRIGVEF